MTLDTIITKITHIILNDFVVLAVFFGSMYVAFMEFLTPTLTFVALAAGAIVTIMKAWVSVDFTIRYYKMLWFDKNPIRAEALKNNYKSLKRREAKI